MAAIEGLVRAFDLDGDGRGALFADLNLLVVALDGGAVVGRRLASVLGVFLLSGRGGRGRGNVHSAEVNNVFESGDGVFLDGADGGRDS